MNFCAVSERKCEGICPETRIKRGQKGECPAFYYKENKKDLRGKEEYREDE